MLRKISLSCALLLLAGCAGTFSAYRAAEDLEDSSYVLSEHYAALVAEGIRLRDNGTLTGPTLVSAQRAEAAARPVILKMGEAARAWESARSADNQKALEIAITDATRALHELIDAMKGRGPSAELQRIEAELLLTEVA
jgi:hypothetical protein